MSKKVAYYTLGLLTFFLIAWKTSDNLLKLGDGSNSDKTIEADIGSGTNNPKLKFDSVGGKWTFTNDGVNSKDIGSGGGGGGGINLLTNPGCENGTSTPDDWTASGGTLTRTTVAGEVAFENAACEWDSNGSGQTLIHDAVIVPNLLEGQPCLAEITYLADTIVAGDYNFRVELDDGTDISLPLDLAPTNGAWRKAQIAFTCPTDDGIQFKITSAVADPDQILLDQNHLGSSTNSFLAGDQSEIVAHAYYETTANCAWNAVNSSTLVAFNSDADCPSITVDTSSPLVTVNTADNDLPDIVFNQLPSGTYEVTAVFTGNTSVGTNQFRVALNDGTTTKATTFVQPTDSDREERSITAVFTHNGGAKTFRVFGACNSANCFLENSLPAGQIGQRLTFTVKRYSRNSVSKITLDTQGWFIDANIGGANPTVSSDVSTYTELTNGSLDLVLNPGSAPVEIACASGTASTGLTCSSNESVGIAFNPPYPGAYLICADYAIQGSFNVSTGIVTGFQWTETTNTSSAIVTNGGGRTWHNYNVANSDAEDFADSSHNCSVFNISSLTKKTFRFMYETDITGAASWFLKMDRASATGQPDFHVTVVPLTQQFPQAIAVDPNPPRCMIRLDSGNGHGSTNTRIRRFSNITENLCTDGSVTLSQSATLGDQFNIVSDGTYGISYAERSGSASTAWGISRNSNQLTTSIFGITTLHRLLSTMAWNSGVGDLTNAVSTTAYLVSGDVIRAHTDGGPTSTSPAVQFSITRLSK